MRVVCASSFVAGLLAVPVTAAAASPAIPDLSGFPISAPRRISAGELERIRSLPLPKVRAPLLRLEAPPDVRIVDDVPLLEVESCDAEPGITQEPDSDPSCAVFKGDVFSTGGGGEIQFYDYTWQTTVLGRKLLELFGDEVTTYIVFNQYPTSDFGGAFYLPIYSEVEGIGATGMDLRGWFGSGEGGALRGIVSMNMWWSCEWGDWFQAGCTNQAPWDTSFRSLHGVLGQEVGHEWGAFLRFLNEKNIGTVEWLGRDRSHWSYWLDTGGSPLEGNDWVDDGDGTFHIEPVRFTKYSDFDLYAMGLMPASEVQPAFLIRNPQCSGRRCSAATPPENGPMEIAGERVDITIEQVIATMGERYPSYEESPRFHRQLFVFTRLQGETDEETTTFALEKMGRIRRFWNEYFYEATRERMRAITTVSGRDDYPRFEFTISTEGWRSATADAATAVEGRLRAQAAINDNVEIDAAQYASVELRLALPASAAGKRVRLVFGGLDGVLDEAHAVEIQPVADGVVRTYGADLKGNAGWKGEIGVLRLELVDAAAGDYFEVDRLRMRDVAYADLDDDSIFDLDDNCPGVANADQADTDGDAVGDACDDEDGDGVLDVEDNCPGQANADQADADGDGVGDACEDADGDGIFDPADNCRDVANVDQLDLDADGVGDACDPAPNDASIPGKGGGSKSKKKKDDGGCSSAAGLPSALGLIVAGLALARRRD